MGIIGKKVEQQKRVNISLHMNKACPACGARLALCEKNHDHSQIKIKTDNRDTEMEYYCPVCDKWLGMETQYEKFMPDQRGIPDQTGTRYKILSKVTSKVLRTALMWLVIGMLFFMGGIWLISTASVAKNEGIVSAYGFCMFFAFVTSVLAFSFLYIASSVFKIWRRMRAGYYEVLDNGLLVKEGKQKNFYAWEDFRVVSLIPDSYDNKDAYAFDLAQTFLAIDAGVGNHTELASSIIDNIRQSARIDQRLQ